MRNANVEPMKQFLDSQQQARLLNCITISTPGSLPHSFGVLAGEVDPDDAIVAADKLSQQALDAQAEDLALEDALYSLNKALQDNVISGEVYMKQARLWKCLDSCRDATPRPSCRILLIQLVQSS